ncbi:MAG: glycosyltransferase family 1 protein [Lachnospiraceae bacterium]|nr:glycosyltransferase family 1 protein [Lachnospiraceae bacterium]
MKILVVICTGFVSWGGLTTVAMNYYRAMNKENLQIDFASDSIAEVKLTYELAGNGSKYIQLPNRKNIFKYVIGLKNVLKEGYDVIHIHGNSATMALELFPAMLCRVSKRIVHCHTTQSKVKCLNKLLRPIFLKMYTHAIAVSYEAGAWLFGKDNFVVLNNAIDVNKYSYNLFERKKIREELNISNEIFVIGHVGKINFSKNHVFIVEVFSEILKINSDSVLLLVGDGPLRGELEKLIKEKSIEDKVVFVGMSEETEKWLNAMDYFIFPSNFEGFGLALVEAQANGLPCMASDVVPRLTDATKTVRYMSLLTEPSIWATEIMNSKCERMNQEYIEHCFDKTNLNIYKEAKRIHDLYNS